MWTFYLNASLAVLGAILAVTNKNVVHSLLYFILSLIFLAFSIYSTGAFFLSIILLIIYVGAIMSLFVFVVMLTSFSEELKNFGSKKALALVLLLLGEILFIFFQNDSSEQYLKKTITVKEISQVLFTNYAILVELSSLLLLASLIGAFYVAKHSKK